MDKQQAGTNDQGYETIGRRTTISENIPIKIDIAASALQLHDAPHWHCPSNLTCTDSYFCQKKI